ncbi:MAG TPA: class I SAM-dependent methyltransferase [Cyanothece sp. UBA12306]|nr:class I SAM-dependent methyltransferase [Cyanothece sp. UBA12306]
MTSQDEFLSPKLTPETLDIFWTRTTILSALKETLPYFSETLLDVGCGYMPYKSLILKSPSSVKNYIGLDLEDNIYQKPDLVWDGKTIPLEDCSVDCAMATEVFEHCPEPEIVMKEIWRVLKPGGIIFFSVPFLWNLHAVPYDEYRYTPFSLKRHLSKSGFKSIKIQALGGWDAALAQMLGLWVRRRFQFSGKQSLLRSILSRLLFPIIWLLIKLDQLPEQFNEGLMITGLSGTAIKPEK